MRSLAPPGGWRNPVSAYLGHGRMVCRESLMGLAGRGMGQPVVWPGPPNAAQAPSRIARTCCLRCLMPWTGLILREPHFCAAD